MQIPQKSPTGSDRRISRQRIESVSLQLFRTKGISSTSIADITRETNIAKGTFYIYYKSKNELIDSLFFNLIFALRKNFLKDTEICPDFFSRSIFSFFQDHPYFLEECYTTFHQDYNYKYTEELSLLYKKFIEANRPDINIDILPIQIRLCIQISLEVGYLTFISQKIDSLQLGINILKSALIRLLDLNI